MGTHGHTHSQGYSHGESPAPQTPHPAHEFTGMFVLSQGPAQGHAQGHSGRSTPRLSDYHSTSREASGSEEKESKEA